MWWKLMVIVPLCLFLVICVIKAFFQSPWGEWNRKEKLQPIVNMQKKRKA